MEGVLCVEGDHDELRDISLVSSSCLSFRRRLLERAERRWKVNGGVKRRSCSWRTREQATNVRPVENSLLPTSMTTLSRVRP